MTATKPVFTALLAWALVPLCAAPAPSVSLRVVDRLDLPCEIGALRAVQDPEVAMAVGEQESLALLVSAASPLRNARFRISGLPPGVSCDIKAARAYRRKLRGNQEATQPYLLEPAPAVSLEAGEKAVYWLTFKAEKILRPGPRRITVHLGQASVQAAIEVHPFRLRRDPSVFYGAFCGARDAAITPQHMKDLHERGFDALQFFWGSVSVPVKNDSGRMVVDFTRMERWMADFQEAEMRGPVVWSLGNDSSSHLENMLSQVFGIPHPPRAEKAGKMMNFADIHHPELNRRLKELMLAIKQHAGEKKWPEIVFIIYDEPTERLMEEHEDRYKFIKSFWPELKIYGVTMDRIEWARAINHMVDILVANGDFEAISKLAEESGKPFWLYGSGSSRDEAGLRRSYAWRPWAHSAKAVWFWAYNYHAGDPYDDFDGASADSSMSMVWPSKIPGVPFVCSVSWDGMREAVDDMAYIQTLEWMLGQSGAPRSREIAGQLAALKRAIPSGNPKEFVTSARKRLAAWITELLDSQKGKFEEIRR